MACLAVAALAVPSVDAAAGPPKALPGAHAHNDYNHKRPLHDALERGYVSIEADVFLVDGKLLVGHAASELKPERTLETLYLDALREHILTHGLMFRDDERLTLLVDLKTDGPATYAALAKLLPKYDGVFYDYKDNVLSTWMVNVVVTGNRPIDEITRDPNRRVAIDGRLADLAGNPPMELMPLVSESWTNHFKWLGNGPMPDAERERLREIAEQVQSQRRRLRFWATPDNPAVWKELQAAGVDFIAADDLDALQSFLRGPDAVVK